MARGAGVLPETGKIARTPADALRQEPHKRMSAGETALAKIRARIERTALAAAQLGA